MGTRVLITGIGGFVGSHLAELLVREGAEVHGLDRDDSHPNLAAVARDVRFHRADLLDEAQTARAVSASRPDVVFHLAAQAIPARSWQHPRATFQVNVLGTLELLEALRARGAAPLVVLASTADVYGAVDETARPVREDHPLGPRNPYAASKVAQETVVGQYAAAGAVRSVILRVANTVGPRLSRDLAASAFAAQIAEAEAGAPRVVRVGNLAPRRDFVDVRDVARAYQLAADSAEPGRVYNVGTGSAVPIRVVLDLLLAQARVRMAVEEDPELQRHDDRPALALDATAFRRRTGWAPAVPLQQSLRDTLEHWRAAVTTEARRTT